MRIKHWSVLLVISALVGATPHRADEWPSFRGAFARGVAEGQDLPISWDVSSGENIRWRTEIPGTGHSSPVVWGERVFVTTAVTEGDSSVVLGDEGGIDLASDLEQTFSWRLYCVDAATGAVIWNREAHAGRPRTNRHVKSSQANSTPVTDGSTIVAIFGSEGMVAYDFEGAELWRVDLGVVDPGLFGDPSSSWGHSSSPVIHEGRVFLQVDRHADSFVAAYDLASGEQVWRVERNEKPIWATPTVHVGAGQTQLIVAGGDFDRGLDVATGRELWRFARDYEVKTTTPIVAGDLVVISGGYRGKEIFGVRLDAEGEVQGEELAWTSEPGGPYTSTPVVYRERVYYVRDTGIFNVLDVANGSRLHRARLEGTYSASAVASDGRIFLAGEGGTVRVMDAEAPFAELGAVDMGAPCMATPAIAAGTLFLRCGSGLFAVAKSAS